jgi:hypothetical protein
VKRRRGTNEQSALNAGLPAARAKRVVWHEIDPAGGPGKFLTFEEAMRRFEILDLASLRWLLNLVQGAPLDESVITGEISAFVMPYRDNSSAESRLASNSEALEFVRQFISELKQFVEKRGTGIKWKITFGEVSKTLSWEDIVTGGSLFQAEDWKGSFLLRATELIAEYGSRIRQCAHPDCGRLFVCDQARKQKFCSLRCGAVERQRQFRAKLPDWTAYRRRGRQLRDQRKKKIEKWQKPAKPGKESNR